jgi:succinate dehydrogenase / fumarate reductase membrane anchor subunit
VVKAYFSGAQAWLLQRVTALYLFAFVLFFTARSLIAPPASYDAWRAWMQSTGPRVATLLFFLALALHAWIGLRDIVIDYVKPFDLRLAVLAAIAGGLTATLIWAALVVFG